MADAITLGFFICVPVAVVALALSRFIPELPLRAHTDIAVDPVLPHA